MDIVYQDYTGTLVHVGCLLDMDSGHVMPYVECRFIAYILLRCRHILSIYSGL